MKKLFQHFLLLPLLLGAALVFVVYQVKSKAPLDHEDQQYPAHTVEVITADKIPFRVRAMAFGHVEPATVLKAKAEVSGKISYVHPQLRKGASLKKGTVVLRIEPTTYKLSLNQSKAGLAGSQSSLAQLKTEEKSTKRALELAQRNLDVEIKELNRIQSLWKKRLIARSTLDKEEQKVLSLRQQLQDVKGKLSSYSSRKAATRAQITQSKSQVNQSKDKLGRTEVHLPFDARIGTVSVDQGGFTPAGGLLFEALGVQAVEINAQLPTKQFRPLVSSSLKDRLSENDSATNAISLKDPESLQTILSKMNLEAIVRLVGDSNTDANNLAYWSGELIRMSEAVDPTRDTLGLVIAVDKPYEGIIPGERPPLLKGMYASVELLSPAKPTLVLPRKAIHQGRVYVVSENKTLLIQPVNILFQQGNQVVLDNYKNEHLIGKQIIISEVVPVMEGLPLNIIEAKDYEKKLKSEALKVDSTADTVSGDAQ
ncbi:MAG TPA: HlyD family secretion protein [Thiothrix sp.]|nr:HlyD family secretion protein [Thiothrix sp.]